MSIVKRDKLNRLLQMIPPGSLVLSSWLKKKGYGNSLIQKYRKSGWLEAVSKGVMKRTGDDASWESGLYALQQQAGIPVHIGGISALRFHGEAQYIPLGKASLSLFIPNSKVRLPGWFFEVAKIPVLTHTGNFLPAQADIALKQFKGLELYMSGKVRAFLELLYLAKDEHSIMEAAGILENLTTLKPAKILSLLESCNSIRVKRLFLFLAERSHHSWRNKLSIRDINIGKGKRQLVKDGFYIPKYMITVPRTLTE